MNATISSSSSPFSVSDTAPALARRFAMIMAGLAALVARRFLRMPHLMRFTRLLWSRLNRAVRRFERAMTMPAKPRAPRLRAARAADRSVPAIDLPRGRGWLVRELGWEAAGYMAQLEALLTCAEARALVATSPAVGRILRPICRMLGVTQAATPLAAPKPIASVAARREPIGAPGAVGDCDVTETSA